jgi:DNA-binding NarL/FixJ family response regulator
MTRENVTVVVVDGEALGRDTVLAADGLELVGEATSAEGALATVLAQRPDVVLIGRGLATGSGVDVVRQLRLQAPTSRLLIFADSDEDPIVDAIVDGASGCVLRSAQPQEVVDAIRACAGGQAVVSPRVLDKLLERIRQRHGAAAAAHEPAHVAIRAALTAREFQIFQRLASGRTNLQIGRELTLSANTVSNHIASILAKLQLENRTQAAVHAVRSGIS